VSDGTGQDNEAGENEAEGHDPHGGSEAEGAAEAACEPGADRQVRTLRRNGSRGGMWWKLEGRDATK
jgi:hypothetical protein